MKQQYGRINMKLKLEWFLFASLVRAFNFGVISEYNQRLSKKLNKGHLVEDKPTFFVTSSRPGNFGDHIDFKINIDNWFEENR